MSKENRTCEDRIENYLKGRVSDLRTLWGAPDNRTDDLGTLEEYGLCFDYVAPGTFDDQPEGYFRYQISWGGPSDEFRFFTNPDLTCHRIEYWFMDWFDGAHRELADDDHLFMMGFWTWLCDTGVVARAWRFERH